MKKRLDCLISPGGRMDIESARLAMIPFVDPRNIGGRVLTVLSFFDGKEWHWWVPAGGQLRKMKGEPAEADYFGRERERETDVYFDFLNFMTQRACWADTLPYVEGIRNDIHNLGASLGKLDFFYHSTPDAEIERRFVSTEIEYIFGVCRSIFDLLQEVIAKLWQRIELADKTVAKKQLPKSFRNMVLRDGSLRDTEQIQQQFCVPEALAGFYHRHGPFFKVLRSYRDDVVHSGKDFNCIFVTERGFAVNANVEPFASFGVWNDEHMLPNRLASLRPVVAHVITETLRACEDFTVTIQRIIKFPADIAPGFRLIMRGYYNPHLLGMKDVIANCSWWDEEVATGA